MHILSLRKTIQKQSFYLYKILTRKDIKQALAFQHLWPVIICTEQAQDRVNFADSSSQRTEREPRESTSAGLSITQVMGVSRLAVSWSCKDHRGRWIEEQSVEKDSFHAWNCRGLPPWYAGCHTVVQTSGLLKGRFRSRLSHTRNSWSVATTR